MRRSTRNKAKIDGDDPSAERKTDGTDANMPGFYHEKYDQKGVAELPEWRGEPEKDEFDEDDDDVMPDGYAEHISSVPKDKDIDVKEIEKKALKMSKLPPATTLQLLAHLEYDLDHLSDTLKDLEEPDILPDYVKHYMRHNMAEEQRLHKHRSKRAPRFYFAKTFAGAVDSKTLVEHYYQEKMKKNPKPRRPKPMNADEEAELAELMAKAGIRVLSSKPNFKIGGGADKKSTTVPRLKAQTDPDIVEEIDLTKQAKEKARERAQKSPEIVEEIDLTKETTTTKRRKRRPSPDVVEEIDLRNS